MFAGLSWIVWKTFMIVKFFYVFWRRRLWGYGATSKSFHILPSRVFIICFIIIHFKCSNSYITKLSTLTITSTWNWTVWRRWLMLLTWTKILEDKNYQYVDTETKKKNLYKTCVILKVWINHSAFEKTYYHFKIYILWPGPN